MPKSCTQCNMTYEDRRLHDICQLNYTDVGYHIGNQTKPVDCPLVEIVTCKDCDHCRFELVEGIPYYWCDKDDRVTSEDFFCKDAERRE